MRRGHRADPDGTGKTTTPAHDHGTADPEGRNRSCLRGRTLRESSGRIRSVFPRVWRMFRRGGVFCGTGMPKNLKMEHTREKTRTKDPRRRWRWSISGSRLEEQKESAAGTLSGGENSRCLRWGGADVTSGRSS